MIVKVEDNKALREFAYFAAELYRGDGNFAPPIYFTYLKDLKKIVLERRTYTALLCIKDGRTVGTLLYTVGRSKRKGCEAGFFSSFECIDDLSCAKELFDCMESDLRGRGINYIEGSFAPYDPDNRVGILVQGYEAPMIFTSYNFPYYGRLLAELGYGKAYDLCSLKLDLRDERVAEIKEIAASVRAKLDVRVDSLDYAQFDRDVNDVAEIFKAATAEINYHSAPDAETIRKVAKSMRPFIEPDFIKIARENATGRPIGFCMSIPDYNQILRKTKGHIRPLTILLSKKNINSVRGMLQYVVPDYQGRGLISVLFDATYDSFKKRKITYFEGGTIIENNTKSIGVLQKFGGEINKVYRIFGKEV